MNGTSVTRVLFTGYAPVHFLCFRPLYQQLRTLPRFEVFVSGGWRYKTDEESRYDAPGLYAPFGLPPDHILSVEAIQQQDFDLVFAANTRLISPRRAGVKIQLFHGISFRNVAIRDEIQGWDYYFIIGPYMRRKLAETGLLSADDPRGLSIGFPKTDPLLNGQLNRLAILAQYGFDGSRPILLYAPTGQKHNSLETMGEAVIQQLVATGKYDLLIKVHDHPKLAIDWAARLAPLTSAHTRIVRDFDVIPLLYAADLLLSDASSVSNEYSLLDRPMVFLDVPRLLDKAMSKNPSLDLATWGRRAGIIAKKPEEVASAVAASLGDMQQHSDLRRAMAADLFYNPGSAASAAMEWLRSKWG